MAENVQIPGEFDDENDFWTHPTYDNYEANRLGVVRHIDNKKDIGYINAQGYIHIDIRCRGKRKCYKKHRFIYECFHGLITNLELVVDHINNIKTDNRLDNLQLISHSENQIKKIEKEKIDRQSR